MDRSLDSRMTFREDPDAPKEGGESLAVEVFGAFVDAESDALENALTRYEGKVVESSLVALTQLTALNNERAAAVIDNQLTRKAA